MSPDNRPLILFAAPYFAPACHGGVVQIYLGLLSRMRGFRVVVVADRQNGTPETIEAWDALAYQRYGFQVERIDSFEFHVPNRGRKGLAKFANQLAELLRFVIRGRRQWSALCAKYRPAIIICGGTYSGSWLLPGSLRDAAALVNYIHGEELTMQVGPPIVQRPMRALQRWSLQRADLNIAVSRYTAGLVSRLVHAAHGRLVVLPNFIDHERFRLTGQRDIARAQREWCNATVLLTVARLEKRKGIDQVLRALALLRDKCLLQDHWRYAIAGTGSERQKLEHLTRELDLTNHVEFLGYIDESQLAATYEAADVFIQPNREIDGDTEGFGVVFLEASACGLPVIGGKAGGTADAIDEGESGLRVDGESVSEIADAIALLMSDSALRNRFSRRGVEWAKRFNVEAAAGQWNNLLSRTLSAAMQRE